MKRKFIFFAALLPYLWILPLSISEAGPPKEGSLMPSFVLPAPDGPSQREYLGLKEKKEFNVKDIISDLVIVELFSMYCTWCQKEAPEVNRLYSLMKQSGLPIRLLGIGVGNSPMEVDYFRKTYQVEFPLFPDQDLEVHKILGEPNTPYFIAFKPGEGRILYSKVGTIGKAEDFLCLILKRAGLR